MTTLATLAALLVTAQTQPLETPPDFVLKFLGVASLGLARDIETKGLLARGTEWNIGSATVYLDKTKERIMYFGDAEPPPRTRPNIDSSSVFVTPAMKEKLGLRANEIARAVGYPFELKVGAVNVQGNDDLVTLVGSYYSLWRGVPYTSMAMMSMQADTYRLRLMNLGFIPKVPSVAAPLRWNKDEALYIGYQAARHAHQSKSLYIAEAMPSLFIEPKTGRYGIRTYFIDKPNGVDATHIYDALSDPKTGEIFWSDDFPVYEGKPRPPLKLGPISNVYASKVWRTTGKGLTNLAKQPSGSSVEVAIRRKDLLQTATYFPGDKALVASDGTYKVPDDIAKKLSGKS